MTTQPIVHCIECHQPMRVIFQPGIAGRAGYHLATCKTPDCALLNVTLTVEQHVSLSAAQIAAYGRTNESLKARGLNP